MKGLIISLIIIGVIILGLTGYLIFSSTQEDTSNIEENQILNEPSPEIEENNLPDGMPSSDAITQQIYNIEIKDFFFTPKETRIKQGDTVKWTNKDSVRHTVTSNSGSEISSSLISKDQIYEKTFNKKGTFVYHCEPHPSMKGTVIVE